MKRLVLLLSCPLLLAAQAPDTVWTRTFGGPRNDHGNCVQQITEGFIFAGDIGDSACIIKTDAEGDSIWLKTYRFTPMLWTHGISVLQTVDGGYVMAALWATMPGARGMLVRTDEAGDTTWTRRDFGPLDDVVQTADSGFLAVYNGLYPPTGYVVRTDPLGITLWTRTYGDTVEPRNFHAVEHTADGYAIVGRRGIPGDIWLLKLDENGDTLWTRTFGGPDWDVGHSLCQTPDGGYIIVGATRSFGAGGSDVYIVKTDADGETSWTRTYGGAGDDEARTVDLARDSGYVIAGITNSYGAGGIDLWLLKVGPDGDTVWTMTCGGPLDDVGNCVKQTVDGGCVVVGTTGSFGAGGSDMWVVKTAPALGIGEQRQRSLPAAEETGAATIFGGVLGLARSTSASSSPSWLLDITGRRIMDLAPSQNDIRRLAPGVYFVRRDSDYATSKVIVTR